MSCGRQMQNIFDSRFTCSVKSCSRNSLIEPFNKMTVFVPVYMHRRGIDLLTEACLSPLRWVVIRPLWACLCWTFFRLTYFVTDQTTDKHVSWQKTGSMSSGKNIDNFMALYIPYMLYARLFVQLRRTISLVVMVLAEGRLQRLMLLECSNSSTSTILHFVPSQLPRAPCAYWMRVRRKDWWEKAVLKELSNGKWKESFRMTPRSFDKLCILMFMHSV